MQEEISEAPRMKLRKVSFTAFWISRLGSRGVGVVKRHADSFGQRWEEKRNDTKGSARPTRFPQVWAATHQPAPRCGLRGPT
jgi:hypothetical protein